MSLSGGGGGGGGEGETVYGTHEEPPAAAGMSDKVQSLAASIYQEFERMMARYDEDVVKSLMPQLVTVLECLDAAYQRNREHDVELELLREDNEQLVTQYEREKAARKHAEQRVLEAEDAADGERKEQAAKLETLESIARMLELKHKNALEHAARLEERENELKKEYAKLHERYTELFKTHMENMERTKLLLGAAGDRGIDSRNRMSLHPMSRSSGPISFGFASLEGGVTGMENTDSILESPTSASPSPPSPLGDELAAVRTMERAHQTDPITQHSQATSPVAPQNNNNNMVAGRTQTKREQRSANNLYQELSFQDADANLAEGEENTDITGSWVHPGEYASSVNDNYFGMGKEVENLILENNELLATKNALNVVKDDLIARVDELMGEQEILREEVATVNMARKRLKEHVSELEEELRRLRDESANASASKTAENAEESDVPMAQRKKFTRVEMARVIMERNQYKERFMELQEAVRWTEMIRANRNDSLDKKQSIWNFFNRLFNSNDRPARPLSSPQLRNAQLGSGNSSRLRHSRTQADLGESNRSASDKAQQRKKLERRDQYRQVRAHVRKEDGRMQAYGWSLPGRPPTIPSSTQSSSSSSSGLPVPVPVFCRPLTETNPGMKFLCGAGVNVKGNNFISDAFLLGSNAIKNTGISLAEEIKGATEHTRDNISAYSYLNSLVWICSSTHANSTVMVIDANNPADIIESFTIADKHLLCIASVAAHITEELSELLAENAASETSSGQEGDSQQVVVKWKPAGKVTLVTVTSADVASALPNSDEGTPSKALENDEAKEIDENYKFTGTDNEAKEINIKTEIEESEGKDVNPGTSPACPSPPLNNTPPNEKVAPKYSTAMATMWLGAQSGMLYVHSAIGEWSVCLGSVRLKDAVLCLVQCNMRVVVGLADGTVAVFARNPADGLWDLSRYHMVTLSQPQHSVRCLTVVGSTVWCGYCNKVAVLEPASLTLLNCFDTHPRKESQVRQLACSGLGVWVSIRLDSTLRLYHGRTYQHLEDVDIEPYVSKMLGTGKLGFSFVRITALQIASARLWIGTGNGVVISVPLSDRNENDSRTHLAGPGNVIRINPATAGSAIPCCSMAHAQLSFHGHRDAVKFFVAVPGMDPPPSAMLVMSAGEGYIDFRIGDGDMEDSVVITTENDPGQGDEGGNPTVTLQHPKFEHDHLIVWQVATP